MKYKIGLYFRGTGVKGFSLTEEEKDNLLEVDDLEDAYFEMADEKEDDYAFDHIFLTESSDRYELRVTDENGKVVYESENVKDLLNNDKTWDIEDFEFEGEEDGYYLLNISTVKGCGYETTLDINGKFEPEKLYVIQDRYIDDELFNDTTYPPCLYYQKGEEPHIETDYLDMELIGEDFDDQYWDIYLMELECEDEWHNLLND